jgi:hypothetical protein
MGQFNKYPVGIGTERRIEKKDLLGAERRPYGSDSGERLRS